MATTLILVLPAMPQIWRAIRRWIFHIGGLGLIPLGILDNSVVPVPGSMDVLTIVLAARDKTWWPYYTFMATAGSVIGGYLTYRIGIRGGKAGLQRRVSRRVFESLCGIPERWRFGSVFVPALLPPPLPMVPFLVAAGAMQYPARRFLAALAAGRAIRYSILAYLGVRYGNRVAAEMRHTEHPVLWTAAAAAAALLFLSVGIGTFIREHKRMNRAHA